MIQYMLYMKQLSLFEDIYNAQGQDLSKALDAIRDAVAGADEPFEAVRGLRKADIDYRTIKAES
jgi:hypothetical protein